jgi:hypothetical protein
VGFSNSIPVFCVRTRSNTLGLPASSASESAGVVTAADDAVGGRSRPPLRPAACEREHGRARKDDGPSGRSRAVIAIHDKNPQCGGTIQRLPWSGETYTRLLARGRTEDGLRFKCSTGGSEARLVFAPAALTVIYSASMSVTSCGVCQAYRNDVLYRQKPVSCRCNGYVDRSISNLKARKADVVGS